MQRRRGAPRGNRNAVKSGHYRGPRKTRPLVQASGIGRPIRRLEREARALQRGGKVRTCPLTAGRAPWWNAERKRQELADLEWYALVETVLHRATNSRKHDHYLALADLSNWLQERPENIASEVEHLNALRRAILSVESLLRQSQAFDLVMYYFSWKQWCAHLFEQLNPPPLTKPRERRATKKMS